MATGPRYSWICRDAAERARFMALHARLSHVNQYVLAFMALCLAPALFTVDNPVITCGLAVVGFAQYAVVQQIASRFPRPELWIFASLLGAEVAMCGAVIASGLTANGALGLVFWPAAGLAGRFPNRVVVVGTAVSFVLVLVGFAAGAPETYTDAPFLVTGHIGVIAAIIVTVSVVRLSDVAHHSAATIDALTGLPNRVALRGRADALRTDDGGAALILLDIDHFKRVNDGHGHQAGDEVLAAFGEALADAVREPDIAYRIGGEEFAIVLPGVGLAQAADIAQRVLQRVRETPLAGHAITTSAGVAAVAPGDPVEWRELFARADAALYRAKEEGRDRVCAGGGPAVAAARGPGAVSAQHAG